MLPSSISRSSIPFGLLLALTLAMPFPSGAEYDLKSQLDGAVTPDRLPPESSRLEDRISLYEAVLEQMASAAGTDDQRFRRDLPGFQDLASDLSVVMDPEEAISTARDRTGAVGSSKLYESLGVELLRAARLARFDGDEDRALHHLRAARLAFELADREKAAAGFATGKTDFIDRAMVRLEEILVTDSEAPWNEAADLLAKQLEVTPTGPMADWARRIADDPDTYVGDDSPLFDAGFFGGDIRPPVKIFAPQPRFPELAKRARVQGVVIIQTVIDRHGTVASVKLLKGLPMGLADETMRAVATWLFEPATLYGQPVSVLYNLTVAFRMPPAHKETYTP